MINKKGTKVNAELWLLCTVTRLQNSRVEPSATLIRIVYTFKMHIHIYIKRNVVVNQSSLLRFTEVWTLRAYSLMRICTLFSFSFSFCYNFWWFAASLSSTYRNCEMGAKLISFKVALWCAFGRWISLLHFLFDWEIESKSRGFIRFLISATEAERPRFYTLPDYPHPAVLAFHFITQSRMNWCYFYRIKRQSCWKFFNQDLDITLKIYMDLKITF